MKVAIIDADLVGRNKHRFPNLVCMKLSGYYKDQGDEVELNMSYDNISSYDKVFISKVFTDTPIDENILNLPNVEYGGTGFFYDKAPKLSDEVEHHMPDYHLYDEWVNEAEWGDTKWQGILPIRKWSELDVWLYTLWRNIEINPKYKKGYARVGCHIACPYYTKSTWVLDKYWYPTMRTRWEDILRDDFIKNKKWIVMNCTIDEYINQAWNGGAFREKPTKEVIEEFARYNGLDEGDTKVAEQYFNKYCANGCKSKSGKPKKIKDRDAISMNMKFHGREINKFLCKKCFMKLYEMDETKWNCWIERFKQDGCALFTDGKE